MAETNPAKPLKVLERRSWNVFFFLSNKLNSLEDNHKKKAIQCYNLHDLFFSVNNVKTHWLKDSKD